MGSIIERSRKDGSKAFVAQIVIKKAGAIAHREAQSFDRRQAANAWIVKREEELKKPGGLERKEDPTLSAVIDRYIAESQNAVLGTKAQVLKTIKNSDLGEIRCSDITSNTLVSFARELTKNVEPQTCGNYFSHLSNIFKVARPAWGYRSPDRLLMMRLQLSENLDSFGRRSSERGDQPRRTRPIDGALWSHSGSPPLLSSDAKDYRVRFVFNTTPGRNYAVTLGRSRRRPNSRPRYEASGR